METTAEPRYQGQARKKINEVFAWWGRDLAEASAKGEPIVHMYGGWNNIVELFRSFGFRVLMGEVLACQPAAKKEAPRYIAYAEEVLGYSTDICGFHLIDVARMVGNLGHPMGQIPKPSLAVVNNSCIPTIKWSEMVSRQCGVPTVTFDVPHLPTGGALMDPSSVEYQAMHRYIVTQLREATRVCERITGRKFDEDKLAEMQVYSNRMLELWSQIMNLNRGKPAVFDSMADGVNYIGIFGFRGTKLGVEYLELLLQELQERRDLGIEPVPGERFRLITDGLPCYPYMRPWVSLFHKWKATFVWSHYNSFVGGGAERGFRFDTSRPLEALADYFLALTRGDGGPTHMFAHFEWPQLAQKYQADGVVLHITKSCRIGSATYPDWRERLAAEGIPCLLRESDIVDPRYYSEAQLKNRVDAFMESLDRKKLQAVV